MIESKTGKEIKPHHRWSEHCGEKHYRFFLCSFGTGEFRQILGLRSRVYGSADAAQSDPIDEYSEHYLCLRGEEPVSALRVTRCEAGELDCQAFFPAPLIERCGNLIGSATRFVALPEVQATSKIAQLVVEAAWLDQLERGIRLDLINVHERAVKYYGRLGYELIANSSFTHPKWRTPSQVMVFPATPDRETPIRPVFDGIGDPFDLKSLRVSVDLVPWTDFSRASRAKKGIQ